MASAMETESYYCHTCDERIRPITEEIICPNCQNGFVELVTEEIRNSFLEEGNQSMATNVRQAFNQNNSADLFNIFNQFFGSPGFSPANVAPQSVSSGGNSNSSNEVHSNAVPFLSTSSVQNPVEQPSLNRQEMWRGRHGDANSRTFLSDVMQNAIGFEGPMVQFPFGLFPQWNFTEIHGNADDYVWGPSGLDDIISQLLGQLESAGPPPASDRAIKDLPTIEIDQKHVESGKECSVCMEAFGCSEKAKKLPCNHFFHIPCIEPWLKLHNTCPICRKLVDDSCNPSSSTSGSNPISSASSTGGASSSVNAGSSFRFSVHPRNNDDDHTYAE